MEARIVCAELLDATVSITPSSGHEPIHANSIMSRRLERLFVDAEADAR